MKKKYAIGADIGGSHICSVLVDLEHGTVILKSFSEQKVNNKASADEILKCWSVAIQKTADFAVDGEIQGIGIAMPGPFDYESGVALLKDVDKYDSLYGVNVGIELQKRLNLPAEFPIRFLNDAMSFAVGECWQGQSSGYEHVVAITLGTGFGSAFLSEGVPQIGGEGVPAMGYVYNIPYKNSMADDYFSTRWITKEYFLRTGIHLSGVKEIAECAPNDVLARKLFEDFGIDLGTFMAPLLLNFKADCLVIGGNISGAYPLFGPSFENALKEQNIYIKVVISELMEKAAMAGSARLLDPIFWEEIKPLLSKI